MLAYSIRRSLWALPTMFAVLVFIFVVMRVLPGDPAYAILGDEAPPEALDQFRRNWGLDRPLPQQFAIYMSGLLTGDLGLSMANRQPILPQLLRAMPYTLDLTIAGSTIGLLLGIPLGVFTARHRNSSVDYVGRIVSLAGLSVPSFYLGILLIFFLSYKYQWFPGHRRWRSQRSVEPIVSLDPAGLKRRLVADGVHHANYPVVIFGGCQCRFRADGAS